VRLLEAQNTPTRCTLHPFCAYCIRTSIAIRLYKRPKREVSFGIRNEKSPFIQVNRSSSPRGARTRPAFHGIYPSQPFCEVNQLAENNSDACKKKRSAPQMPFIKSAV